MARKLIGISTIGIWIQILRSKRSQRQSHTKAPYAVGTHISNFGRLPTCLFFLQISRIQLYLAAYLSNFWMIMMCISQSTVIIIVAMIGLK